MKPIRNSLFSRVCLNNLLIIITGLFSVLLESCEPKEPEVPIQLVIDGFIDSDSHAVVVLSLSAVASDTSKVADKIVQWGKVIISDGVEEEVLIGTYASDWLPPYRYYGRKILGKPGREYTVTAEFEDFKAYSTVRMPSATPIDRLEESPVEGHPEFRIVKCFFTVPEDCPAYFILSLKEEGKFQQPLPTYLGIIETTTPGQSIELAVFNPKKFNQVPYEANLRNDTGYEISLNRVTPEVYMFRKAFNEMLAFGHNPFLSTAQTLPTNIVGGLGIWSAQGTSRVILPAAESKIN